MSLGRAATALTLGLLPALPTVAGEPAPLTIRAERVEIRARHLDGLVPLGAWVLTADHPDFGGLSGLVIADGALAAVSDEGHLVAARIAATPDGPAFTDARIIALRDADGSDPGKSGGDAEALTLIDGQLHAAFERDHRIARLSDAGVIGPAITIPAFEGLPSNAGIEGLATVDGLFLAIPETPQGDGFPVFALAPDGRLLAEGGLHSPPPHRVTGAEVGQDGRLYVVLRDFSMLHGVSIRVRRHVLAGSPPLPLPSEGATLAAFEADSGIDNMEAIALWRDGQGRLRLWILSDDNFNPLQRTLLLDFEVTP